MYVYALYFVSFYMVVYGLFGIFWSMSTLLNETILTYIKKKWQKLFQVIDKIILYSLLKLTEKKIWNQNSLDAAFSAALQFGPWELFGLTL